MNTRKNTFMVSALVALLVVSMATVALAQGPGQGQGRNGKGNGQGQGQGQGEFGPQMQVERMAKRLDLSADQVASIKEIRESGRTENQEMRKEAMRLRNEKRGEMLKDDPSTKTVLALTTELGDLRTKMQVNRMENRLEVRKVLTPEQRDKMLLSGEGRGDKNGRGERFGQGNQRGNGNQQGNCNQQGQGRGNNNGRNGSNRGNGSGNGNW